MLNGSLESGRLTGEVRPDKAKTANDGPTAAQWFDEERRKAKKFIRYSMETPFCLLSHRFSESLGECRLRGGQEVQQVGGSVPFEVSVDAIPIRPAVRTFHKN